MGSRVIDADDIATALPGLSFPASGQVVAGTTTAHGVVVGAGVGAVATTAVGTSGQVLTSNGPGADPTWAAASGFTGAFPASTAITQNGSTILNVYGAGAGDGTVTLIGKGAGASLPNNALNLTAIGFNALGSDTGVNSENVAVGWGALRSVTTGQFCTALGLNAGGLFITDSANTVLGCDAMRNSTGPNNVCVGDTTLRDGAHTQSVAVGHAALSANGATTANTSDNTAVGYSSMSAAGITTATGNTCVGSQSGKAITTGNSNVIVGFNAGPAITTAAANVIAGQGSGLLLTTGGSNVVVGPSALQHVTTGTFNVAIGRISLQNAGAAAGFQTAVGDSTMANWAGATNGSNNGNVALGAFAMRGTASATFNSNTAIGAQSGLVMSTGSSNTFLGINTALIATTAAINTIIGANVASTTFGTGTGNVLIGVDSSTDTAAVGTSDTLLIKGRTGGAAWLTGTGGNTATPTVSAGGLLGTAAFTVATLPAASAANKGCIAYVTDATSPTYRGALTGGGSVVCLVFSNGSSWTSGG